MRFELTPFNRNCRDEELLQNVRDVAAALKKPSITIAEYKAHGRFHPSTLISRFAGWSKTLELAGLEITRFNGGVSANIALIDLQEVASRLGKKTLTQDEYRAHGRWSTSPLVNHYGTWLKALRAAGLQESRSYRVPDDVLFANLQQVWEALGRQPKYSEIAKPLSDYAAGTYAQRFGSWRAALEAFVAAATSQNEALEEQMPVDPSPAAQKPIPVRRTSRAIGWSLRYRVLSRDRFRCVLCGAAPALQPGVVLHVDHTIPWSKGGETVLENLRATCDRCNIGKSDLTLE
jgi:hypothetical protein